MHNYTRNYINYNRNYAKTAIASKYIRSYGVGLLQCDVSQSKIQGECLFYGLDNDLQTGRRFYGLDEDFTDRILRTD